MDYRTLVIAPKTDLYYQADEVANTVNMLGARVLQGERATVHGLLAELENQWDILWFATHGTDEGVILTDGLLSTSELTSTIRSSRTQLTVFNTCNSIWSAHKIHNELLTYFVCTVREVPDRQAFFLGKLFAMHLRNGESFFDAYQLSRPGQDHAYIFLAGIERDVPPREQAVMPQGNIGPELNRLQETVNRLAILIDGNAQYNQDGLLATSKELKNAMIAVDKRLSNVETVVVERVNELESSLKFVRNILFLVLAMVAIFLIILSFFMYNLYVAG